MRLLGIDEAGRGCVFGPLVVAAFLVESTVEATLWDVGAADSKTLTPERRTALRAALEGLGVATIRRIEPEAIDKGNLNRLEEDAIVDLVLESRPDRVVVDALGHPRTLEATVERLRARVEPEVRAEWVMEPKADANHAPVAAASIFAKTTRDQALDALREEWGLLGSGYPSDPVTRAWLAEWCRGGKPWPHFV
ncbi:MAG: ribonuclease HII, partial [Deltaproteobacteria bacterium]|nr:ribonuclease HII [Deltaproteobacteria bacterium]